jgi:hypothetical protein
MLHGDFQCAIATHRRAADAASGSCSVHAIRGFDHGNKFRHDHVLPLLAAVAHVRIEARSPVWNRNDELADLSVGDHASHDLIGLSARAPASLVLEKSVKEVQHRILLRRRGAVGRREVNAIPHLSSEQLAWKRLVVDLLRKNFRAKKEQ